MTNLTNIQNEMLTEANKTASVAGLVAGHAAREIDGVQLSVTRNPVNTNSKTLLQTIWKVNGTKVAAAKVEAAIDEASEEASEEAELPATLVQTDAYFAALYSKFRTAGQLSKVAALRATASSWQWTRKEFVAAAEKYGVNTHTAATQWQQGRKGA